MAKPNDPVFFAICAAAGAATLLGCVLPTFELHLSASVGAGGSQRVYHYYRDLHLATFGEPGALVFVLAGVTFLVAGFLGVRRPRWWLVVAVAAVSGVAFVQTVRTVDYVDYTTSPGDAGYLAPAVRDFRADVLRKPEAEQPEYRGPSPGAFTIRKRAGWQLIGWSVAIFSLVAWIRTVLLFVPSPRKAAVIYIPLLAVVAVAVFAWWLRDFHPS